MATAPTSRRLNLTRDQLAAFLTDQQQIRQFELLFSTVDTLQVIVGTDFEFQADNASATANEALAQINALSQVVDLNGPAEALSYLAELSKQVQALESAPPFSAPPAVTPASPTTSVQFNNAGAFGGASTFTYNSGTDTLSVGNLISANFTDVAQGLVPASGGGTTNFLRADGTFAAPPAVTPASPSTSVQFNNAGAFGGSANFTYNTGTNTVSFGNITGSALGMTIQPLAPTSGSAGALTVQATAGVATNGAGGALNLTSGNGVGTGVGGVLNLTAGNAVSGAAGAITFNAGDSSFSTGGALTFNAGDSASAANGGAITFNAGTGYAGGSMTFTAGAATGAASGAVGGSMSFAAGNSSSAANAGDLTFVAGSSGAGSFSGFRGGNLSFSAGSSDFGPAGSFYCATSFGLTDSGPVTFETGFASGGTSGSINFITGAGGFSIAGDAGNLVYTGGTAGNDSDDFSGTGGGLVFTGGFGYGSAGIGGSFTFTAGGGNATNGSINLATLNGTSIQLADNGARQLGFFGATPVGKPTITGSRASGAALQNLLTQLASLGLITDSTTI